MFDKRYWEIRNKAFAQGQKYNNYVWAVKITRLNKIKGIGEQRMAEIIAILEQPLDEGEKEIADKQYNKND